MTRCRPIVSQNCAFAPTGHWALIGLFAFVSISCQGNHKTDHQIKDNQEKTAARIGADKEHKYHELSDIKERAEMGISYYQHMLANCYRYAQGTHQDLKLAFHWDMQAAKQDHKEAIYYIARAYHRGEGVPIQSGNGIKWYERGVRLGSTSCMLDLAYIYWDGRGTFRNRPKALSYFTLAAKAGDQHAKDFMLQKTGKAVKPNLEE